MKNSEPTWIPNPIDVISHKMDGMMDQSQFQFKLIQRLSICMISATH